MFKLCAKKAKSQTVHIRSSPERNLNAISEGGLKTSTFKKSELNQIGIPDVASNIFESLSISSSPKKFVSRNKHWQIESTAKTPWYLAKNTPLQRPKMEGLRMDTPSELVNPRIWAHSAFGGSSVVGTRPRLPIREPQFQNSSTGASYHLAQTLTHSFTDPSPFRSQTFFPNEVF